MGTSPLGSGLLLSFGALLLGACSAAEVPAAPADEVVATDEAALLPWWPHTETHESYEPFQGAPAWSSDGTEVAGVALSYERQIQFPPLQGWWSKRNFSFRVFTQRVTASGLGGRELLPATFEGFPSSLHDLKEAGYLLVGVATRSFYLLRRDGTKTLLLDRGEPTGVGDATEVLPSPTGDRIAIVACTYYREVPQADGSVFIEPVSPVPCRVRFVDPSTLGAVGEEATVSLPAATNIFDPKGPRSVTWTTDGDLLVTDRVATAFAFTPGAAPRAATVPTCGGPTTASSKVAADGRRLGVKNDKVAVLGTAPVEERFGCR